MTKEEVFKNWEFDDTPSMDEIFDKGWSSSKKEVLSILENYKNSVSAAVVVREIIKQVQAL